MLLATGENYSVCAYCGTALENDAIDITKCEDCGMSIFEPWYVKDPRVQFTRCSECSAIVNIGDDHCRVCAMAFNADGYWAEFSHRFTDETVIYAPWMKMLCCNSAFLGACGCEIPLHPAIYGALRDWEYAPRIYKQLFSASETRCETCRFQYTMRCKPLVAMISEADQFLAYPSGGTEWSGSEIDGCDDYEFANGYANPSMFVPTTEASF